MLTRVSTRCHGRLWRKGEKRAELSFELVRRLHVGNMGADRLAFRCARPVQLGTHAGLSEEVCRELAEQVDCTKGFATCIRVGGAQATLAARVRSTKGTQADRMTKRQGHQHARLVCASTAHDLSLGPVPAALRVRVR
jgi:hypothetical protein